MLNACSWPRWGRLAALALVAGLAATSCSKKGGVSSGKGPAMWHVADADSDVYIFGSFHLLPAGVNWQRADIKTAFNKAMLLVLETDVRNENSGAVAGLVTQYGIASKDQPLRSRLSPEERAKFEEVCTALKLPAERLDAFQPWFAATALTVQYAQNKGLAAESGVEATLITQATTAKKQFAFLETPEEQIRFLAELPADVQMKMLTATLDELKNADAEMEAMQKAWASGDTAEMAKVFDKSIKEVPELYNALITERNKRWADEITRLMAGKGTVFIAVGAGHLVGNGSVIALLREHGLKVDGP